MSLKKFILLVYRFKNRLYAYQADFMYIIYNKKYLAYEVSSKFGDCCAYEIVFLFSIDFILLEKFKKLPYEF